MLYSFDSPDIRHVVTVFFAAWLHLYDRSEKTHYALIYVLVALQIVNDDYWWLLTFVAGLGGFLNGIVTHFRN